MAHLKRKFPRCLRGLLEGEISMQKDHGTSGHQSTVRQKYIRLPFYPMPLKLINRREFILTVNIYIHDRKPVEKSGKDHTILLMLSSGVHRYRFIVDGERRFIPDLPCETDNMGQIVNLVDVHVSILLPFTLNI